MGAISGSGAAGRCGPDIRSDCWVEVEPAEEGGIRLDLISRVSSLFGPAIAETVEETLRGLGVENASVRVEDTGALPWVLQARLEAALRRSRYPVSGLARPRPVPPARPLGTARDRMRRSRLYLPGNEPKFMLNAALHRPDGLILDLEDSVHPAEKDAARLLVRNALRAMDFGEAERMVRINQGSPGFEDLDAVIPEGPELILLPKVESPEQVREAADRIDDLRRRYEIGHSIWLMPILESALGVENAFEIARSHEAVVALTIGLEDYTADIGVPKTPGGEETLWARQRLVNAAHAAGIQPIDSVFGDVADEAGLLQWARRSRAMGFEGMGCVHPRQIRVIHRGFSPTPEEIDKALRIEEAFQKAEAEGLGVVSLGSKMIDRPVVLRARRLLERARAGGLLGRESGSQAGAAGAPEQEGGEP